MGVVWRWMLRVLAPVAGLVVVAIGIVAFSPQTASALFAKAGATALASLPPPPLPAATELKEAHWLNQSWSDRDRYWFRYTSQGTATLPVPYDCPDDLPVGPGPLPCATGPTTVETTELGSSNLGHSFEGTETDVTKLPSGVIGCELSPEERDNLIEYLKTL